MGMAIKQPALIISAFRHLELTKDFSLSEWDLLVRQARRAGVLARLWYLLERQQLIADIPAPALMHFESAMIYADQMRTSLNWEVHCIRYALEKLNLPLVFLKGAAYVLAGNDAALGRVFSDIDILVPKQSLMEVEQALIFEGWKFGSLDAYDQMYYRKWMHEIPPMQHVQRHTSIDVHHNILPLTSSFCPDPNKLLENINKIEGQNIWVLAPEDRVLHSAVHLFHEGEFDHGFRDLTDLDLLIKEFAYEEGFWLKLQNRATELNQEIPLYYALRFTTKILQTPVPVDVLEITEAYQANKLKRKVTDFVFLRALMPNHFTCSDSWTRYAHWFLYLRSHWLKMPWYLLIPHLSRKAWMRLLVKDQH